MAEKLQKALTSARVADKSQIEVLTLDDLKRSGLDKKDLQRLKLVPLTREQTDEYVGEPRASYKIPYFTLDGKAMAYARVRFVENKKGKAFRDTSIKFKSNGGSFRYSQPFNSSPHIYFPPYYDWRKIARDPGVPILITEGEKKAAKACKEGIACIALGGVYGYRSGKRLQDLIPEFSDIDWNGRHVEVCYDADVMMKAEVRQALGGIALALTQEFALGSLNFVFLDAEVAGPKTGLDDYLLEYGKEEFEKLPRQEYKVAAKIQLLNQRVCWVESVGRFYDVKSKLFYKNFNHVREAFMNMGEELIDGKRHALVVDLWGKSNNRRVVQDVRYLPGTDAEVTEDGVLNTWVAPETRPKRGNAKRWLEMVHFIMRRPEYAEWFLKWLAYPVQHPGTKLFQATFVYGSKQGIGKTFIVDPIMEFVYGPENFYRLSNDDIQSNFNSYAGKSQFVVTNEIYMSEYRDRRVLMSKLKDMVTREKVTVNEKYMPKIPQVDYCNYYFTSNHADALLLDPGDRRYFVIEAPNDRLPREDYIEMDEWVREKDGASIIQHYLQNSVDLSDFNPKGDALATPWKRGLIDLSKDVLAEFSERLIEDPESLFMVDGHLPDLELYRAEDLVRLFETTHPRYRFNVTAKRMGNMLSDQRIEKRKVRTAATGPQIVLYALFKRDDWRARKNSKWAEHYFSHHKRYGGGQRRH